MYKKVYHVYNFWFPARAITMLLWYTNFFTWSSSKKVLSSSAVYSHHQNGYRIASCIRLTSTYQNHICINNHSSFFSIHYSQFEYYEFNSVIFIYSTEFQSFFKAMINLIEKNWFIRQSTNTFWSMACRAQPGFIAAEHLLKYKKSRLMILINNQ